MKSVFGLLLPLILAAAQEHGAEHLGPLLAQDALDLTPEGRAFVEITSARPTAFVRERIPLRIRFSIEREFLREHLVQLFQRQLDIPAQVWITLPEAAAEGGAELGQSFAFGEVLSRAVPTEERRVDGRVFTVIELVRTVVPAAPGELAVPAPLLRFAFATRFDEDFVNGRMAVDRRAAFVHGAPLTLTIQPLPEEGRPREFSGAVGAFSARAETDAREVAVGQHFALRLIVDGASAEFAAPELAELPGLRVFGTLADANGARRTFIYDLAASNENVREIPSIALAYFDPNPPAGYHSVKTRPLPIVVRGVAEPVKRGLAPVVRATILLLPILFGLGVALWLRSRRRDSSD